MSLTDTTKIQQQTYCCQQAFGAKLLHHRQRFSRKHFQPVFDCQCCVIRTPFLWVTLQQLLPQTLFAAVKSNDCINLTNLHVKNHCCSVDCLKVLCILQHNYFRISHSYQDVQKSCNGLKLHVTEDLSMAYGNYYHKNVR